MDLFNIHESTAGESADTEEEDLRQIDRVEGVVIDAETGEPVAYAYVHLEQINRTATSGRDGRFTLRNVPEGDYTAVIHRVGYRSEHYSFTVHREMEDLVVDLQPSTPTGEEVRVVADRDVTVGGHLEHASAKVSGEELRRNLGSTLSSTLSEQPGFAERGMGVAPGRPVVRGLGDQRVLILEDGQRTGDVSWTSADHSVSVDPSAAQEIEIARGPAALEHGAGAIGGIVNVVRNQIPNSVPSRTTGTLSLQGETVNDGGSGSGSVTLPVSDNFALNMDLNGRFGDDARIPGGRLTNSWMRNTNNGFGTAYIQPWGYAGLSGNMYYSEYGIPPDPEGGHPAGVDIEMLKYQTELRTEILLERTPFHTLEARGSFIHYEHSEIEASGAVGTRYEMDTLTGSLKARHGDWGPFDRGVIGMWGEGVDYSVFGSRTPDSNSWSGALFSVQETDIGRLHLEAGLRLNHTLNRPKQERQGSTIGQIRQRSFTGLESSLSAIFDLGRDFYAGTTFMHSWRSPTLEELYSEGPHLAAYSFEVGNPDLEAERGLGNELFLRYRGDRLTMELAGYYNHFSNYLYAQDTGRQSVVRADLREFQYTDSKARIYGMEASADLQLSRTWRLDGNLSWTLGDRHLGEMEMEELGFENSTQPLPMMPPLKGSVGLRFQPGAFSIGVRSRLAATQSRLAECPADADPDLQYPCETPTDGYAVFDLQMQYRFDWGPTLHTLSLNGLNLMNTEYYNHLSVVKDLFPEPGRSVQLLYRVYF